MLHYSEVPGESFPAAPLRHPDEEQGQQRGTVAASRQSDRPRRPRAGHPLCLVTPRPTLSACHTETCAVVSFTTSCGLQSPGERAEGGGPAFTAHPAAAHLLPGASCYTSCYTSYTPELLMLLVFFTNVGFLWCRWWRGTSTAITALRLWAC